MKKIYIVTAKLSWLRQKPRTRHTPILADAEYLRQMETDFDTEELRNALGDRSTKEPLVFIGAMEDLLKRVSGLSEQDFLHAPEMSEVFQKETARYLDALVRAIPNPTLLLKRMLNKRLERGESELLGIRLAGSRSDYVSSDLVPRHLSPSEFLREYRQKLLMSASAGLIPEVDPDLDLEDLSREFLFDLLAQELTLSRYGTLPTIQSMREQVTPSRDFGFNRLFGEKSYA